MNFVKILLFGIFLTLPLESLSSMDNKTQQLLKSLRSTDSDERISVIKGSKEVASENPRVHKALFNIALFDPNGSVRTEAYWVLIHTDLNQPDTIERLAAALSHETVRTRLSAVKLSAGVHPDNSVIHLKVVHAALFDTNDSVKKAAFIALKRIKPNHETVINKIVEVLVEHDGYKRAKAVLLVIQTNDNRRAQLENVLNDKSINQTALRRVLREIYANDNRRNSSGVVRRVRRVRSAVDVPSSSKATPTLPADRRPLLRLPDPQKGPPRNIEAPQETATPKENGAFDAMKEVKNILKGNKPSNPDVYSQLIDSALFSENINNYERNKIITALSDVQVEDKDIDKLKEALNGSNRGTFDVYQIASIQRTSIRILGAIHVDNPEIHRGLVDVALYEDNHHTRRIAYITLNNLRLKYPQVHQSNPDIYQRIVDLSSAHKEDIVLQKNAVRTLGGVKPMTSEFYWVLVNVVLFSPDIEVRLVAAEALDAVDSSNIEIQIRDTQIIRKLVEAALAGSRLERKAIVGVLRMIWPDHQDEITNRLIGTARGSEGNVHLSQKVKGVLLGIVQDNEENREKLSAVLESKTEDLENVRRVLREIHSDSFGNLRNAGGGEVGSEVDKTASSRENSTLPEDRESRPPGLQEEVSRSVEAAAPQERATTGDGAFDVLKAANDIILRGNKPADSITYINLVEALLYDSNPDVRRASFRAFEITQPDMAEVYMRLTDALHSNDKPDMQIRALRTLAVLLPADFNIHNSIVDVALYSTDVGVREEANEALRKIKPSSSEIHQRVVDVALYDTSPSTQRNASEAVKSMLGITLCGRAF